MTVAPQRAARREVVAWWIKCDPTAAAHGGWNWPDLFHEYREGEAYLWSVGTALSQKNARLARSKDPVFGYAAGHRLLYALAQVDRGGVFVPGARPPSATSSLPGGFTVALRPVALLAHPVALADVRAALRRDRPEFFRTRFGSIFKVRQGEFAALLRAVEASNPGVPVPAAWRRLARRQGRPWRAAGG